jgi:hypothetical protein
LHHFAARPGGVALKIRWVARDSQDRDYRHMSSLSQIGCWSDGSIFRLSAIGVIGRQGDAVIWNGRIVSHLVRNVWAVGDAVLTGWTCPPTFGWTSGFVAGA